MTDDLAAVTQDKDFGIDALQGPAAGEHGAFKQVQERTKEIGILRAIGASKRDVSSMFNAETIIIGFTSGLLGIVVTYLLCIPINLLVHHLTGINNLSAILPVPAAIILIAISVLLTLIAGFIPSKSAAKKDPVVALRSE